MLTRSFLLLVAAGGLGACTAAEPPLADGQTDFNRDVRPILVQHCLACHGGVKQAGGISFVWRHTAVAEGDSGITVIEPGDAEGSYLLDRVADPDDDYRMPPPEHGPRLSDEEVATLRQWIDQGAKWESPWAFQPPQTAPVPEVSHAGSSVTKLDRFVLARLEEEGLEPAVQADRRQWLRRVSFDLIGLPPTEQEVAAFLADREQAAHDRVVDRLLESPHYGERWASVWLDLARYADTMGFEKDPDRTIWPYRDWVIRSLNRDLPYDQFLLRQIAGDLLPDATLDDHIATGFHRNTQTNTEGGTDDEEYRWSAVVDRVDTTWQALLGVSMGCARCHDHPYDPIKQSDYYAFAAFFNNTRDADLREDWPRIAVPTDPQEFGAAQKIYRELNETRAELHKIGIEARNKTHVWTPLPIDRAESTGETRLVVQSIAGGAEVLAEGTVTDRSHYKIESHAPTVSRITAIRVAALPKNPDVAQSLPEMGFVLSRLRLFIDRAESAASESSDAVEAIESGDPPNEVFFSEVFADETDGIFRPIDSIRDNTEGWGAYTRLRRRRWAVFVLEEPLEFAEGDTLRFDLKHGKATDGQGPLVIQRLRLSATDARHWSALLSDPMRAQLREKEERLLAEQAEIASVATPVYAEIPAGLRRPTHVLGRGNWLSPEATVSPATPGSLPDQTAGDRLALGYWLGSPSNPLTARVFVNRVWAELFGSGLVTTLDDFGSSGADPSHPELLDDLAVRFRSEMDWSVKRLLRELVLSSTYRQDARATPEQIEMDPRNRWLARGPRGRLRAEMVRDQSLVLAGKLNPAIGGPPVMPFQPAGVWQTVYNSQQWETAAGADRFRRAIYTYWKRTAAYPSMVAFDAPSREQCTAWRPTTNTPLQALVTLNDPAFFELAEGLADNMLARTNGTPEDRIAWAARQAIGRDLPPVSLAELVKLYDGLVADPEIENRFAMTLVANVILNLDATLTK